MDDIFMPKNADNITDTVYDDIGIQSHTSCNDNMLPTHINGYNGVTNGYMSPTQKSNTFYCAKCNFTCNKESNWKLHLNTRKHNNDNNSTTHKCVCEECGKTYKHRQGLSRHKKTCEFTSSITTSNTTNTIIKETDPAIMEKMIAMFTQVLTQNQDFMQNVIGKVQGINTNSYNNNNNTNQFNIQMFLNEHCKNAMNISDFIKSLPITAQHYENTKDKGLADTLTNIVVDGLNNLDILHRPIHCTDKKRKVMYVKDDDKWEKDQQHNLILKNLKDLSVLHGKNLDIWQDKNPNYETVEKLQIEFTNIIGELYTNIFQERKYVNKFINSLTNSTYLDEDMKQQYNQNDTLLSTI
jgi:hypothetical protein